MTESNRLEYKSILTDNFEKEVVAFLNAQEGGIIFLGINPDGAVIGLDHVDEVQLRIKDRLKHNISPSCMGLFDVRLEIIDKKECIKITLASGGEKPYYLKKLGMSEKGCFIRIGSASEPMPVTMIETLFSQRTRNSIGKMLAPRSDLHFEQLKIYYQESGYHLNDNFLNTLELLTPEGKQNYAAYLLADENGVSIKVAKYAGDTRVDLIENSEYGYCSLIKAVNRVLDKLEVENKTFAKITYPKRLERRMIDETPLREAVINAIRHNDDSNGAPPKFEFFSDRIEITSMGGLPFGVDQEDFFSGLSSPRNKELMRVFHDIDLVEHLGSGVPRILEKYSKQVFTLSDNYLRVTFFYHKDFNVAVSSEDKKEKTLDDQLGNALGNRLGNELGNTRHKIINAMQDNSKISSSLLSELLGISITAVEKNIKYLRESGYIKRVGGTRGQWELLDREDDL